jgi:hypothetical protein
VSLTDAGGHHAPRTRGQPRSLTIGTAWARSITPSLP